MAAWRWGAPCLYFYSLMYDLMCEDDYNLSGRSCHKCSHISPLGTVHVKSAPLAPWKASLRHKSQQVRIESPRMVRRSGFTFGVVPRFSMMIGKPEDACRVENWRAYVMLITTRVRKTAMVISLSLSGSIELYLPRYLHGGNESTLWSRDVKSG